MAEGPGHEPPGPSPWSHLGSGFELVVPILLGVWLGYTLDRRWGTEPWLVVAGSVLGMAVGFYTFLRGVLSRGSRGR